MLRALVAKYGWKTILGTLLLAAGQAAPYVPQAAPLAPALNCLGVVLGGVGLRAAIANAAPVLAPALAPVLEPALAPVSAAGLPATAKPVQPQPAKDAPHA
jgi:hypothetical protein